MKSVLLCILDGWGVKKGGEYDAISKAKTPNFDKLIKDCPNSEVKTYGEAVGLPHGQMGNSEVGHMNIGSGRIVAGALGKIGISLENGELEKHPVIAEAIKKLSGRRLHLMGLASDGGVHAHIDHITGLAKIFAKNNVDVALHLFTDGRDTSPKSGKLFIQNLLNEISAFKNIEIATISGRFYAMDRDKRWDRVEKAYDAIVSGESENKFNTPIEVIEKSYSENVTDEFIIPSVNKNYKGISNEDGILMANFRADRAREILDAILFEDFDGFKRKKTIKVGEALGTVEYSEKLTAYLKVLFPAETVSNTLGELISNLGLNQLRIAETEKYAHVTFFFNGGVEEVFKGEDRILVPSPKVATYDLKPEMSAFEVTDKLIEALRSGKYSLIVCNFANGDMVGHTGILSAAVKAVETLDACIGKLKEAIEGTDNIMILSADHGNAEEMLDKNGQPHTQHTVGSVPFIIVNAGKNITLKDGRLCDIAPTILELLEIKKPEEMKGISLIN